MAVAAMKKGQTHRSEILAQRLNRTKASSVISLGKMLTVPVRASLWSYTNVETQRKSPETTLRSFIFPNGKSRFSVVPVSGSSQPLDHRVVQVGKAL